MPDSLPELFKEWQRFLEGSGVESGGARAKRLLQFLEILQKANEHLRLVGEASPTELFLTHTIDSLFALQTTAGRIRPGKARCIDIGSGGGFPGIPIRLARPEWSFVLLESVRKKAAFLENALNRLGLKDCGVVSGRAETLSHEPQHREQYDFAFCRAIGPFSTTAELSLPFLRIGGVWMSHRGEHGETEARQASHALEILGGEVAEVLPYQLPNKDKTRYIVSVHKKQPTPDYYPRKVGLPAKRPL